MSSKLSSQCYSQKILIEDTLLPHAHIGKSIMTGRKPLESFAQCFITQEPLPTNKVIGPLFDWLSLSKASHGLAACKRRVLYRRQLAVFQFLEGGPPLIQEASSVLTNWKGVACF